MTQTALPIPAADGTPFELIRREDEHGEFWTGRDMQPLMGYRKWQDFAGVVDKAKAAARNNGLIEDQHVMDSHNVDDHGYRRADYRLSRHGAYLVAMNGDPRKPEIAAAQNYFAVRTRQAEIAEQNINTSRHEIPQSFADALQLAANQAREIERQGQQIAELEPRAQQADYYRSAFGLTAIGTFANDLQQWADQTHGVKILHEQVRDFMAELGLLIRGHTIRNNEPTADAMKRGLMRIKHATYETNEHGTGSSSSARLTQKGCGYVWDRAVRRIASHGSLKPSTDAERTNR